jgi:hypothetical protein
LSHPDVASFVDRTNRYTGRPDRVRVANGECDLVRFAHDQIDYWSKQTADRSPEGYPAAVALLRAVYDIVDRLKTWEETRGLDGAELLRLVQHRLVSQPGGDEVRAVAGQVEAPAEMSRRPSFKATAGMRPAALACRPAPP